MVGNDYRDFQKPPALEWRAGICSSDAVTADTIGRRYNNSKAEMIVISAFSFRVQRYLSFARAILVVSRARTASLGAGLDLQTVSHSLRDCRTRKSRARGSNTHPALLSCLFRIRNAPACCRIEPLTV